MRINKTIFPTGRRTAKIGPAAIRVALVFGLILSSGGAVLPVASSAAAAVSYMATAPGDMPGWHRDFVDDFNAVSLNTVVWARYMPGGRTRGNLSTQDPANVYTSNGQLVLRTHQENGAWTSGGMSSGRGFTATQGKWTFRARFDRAYGIGYVFLLYPGGGAWPPEVDIAEGTAGGPQVMSTLHWDTDNKRKSFFKTGVNMALWHTYGVVMQGDTISFTIDGVIWSTFTSPGVPKILMWFGLQAGAKDCAQSTNECTGSATPIDSRIYVDWIAHWTAA